MYGPGNPDAGGDIGMTFRTLSLAVLLFAYALPAYALGLPLSPWKGQDLTHPEATVLALKAYEGLELLQVLQAGAKAGNIDAMLALTNYYNRAKEFTKAAAWARKAAHAGGPLGERDLSFAYYRGHGVPKNLPKAIYWAKKAAKHNVRQSQYFLAYLHQHGEGLPKDVRAAIPLYEVAAHNGSSAAALDLSKIYKKGQGIPKDEKLARYWANYTPNGGWPDGSALRAAFQAYDQYQHEGAPSVVKAQKKLRSRMNSVSRELFGGFDVLALLVMLLQVRKSLKYPKGSSASFWGIISLIQLLYLLAYLSNAIVLKEAGLWFYSVFYGTSSVLSGVIAWVAIFRRGGKTSQTP